MIALDAYQTTLFGQGEPALRVDASVERVDLDDTAWVEMVRTWLTGADALFDRLARELSWRGGRRPMYGRLVDEPRLHARLDPHDPASVVVIGSMTSWLNDRYGPGINANFANLYRGGSDSVAWHADRIGVERIDPVVALCSLGGPRRFGLRPKNGGSGLRLLLASGDLLVMGGSCQHSWEHCVPKMASAPPRMSLTFRQVDDGPGEQWWYRPVPPEPAT